jgi:hypothetical protein
VRIGCPARTHRAAGAGLAAALIADAEPAQAATGKPLKLDQANTAAATTSVTLTGSGSAVAGRIAVNGNVGVEGTDTSATGGYGVFGVSPKGYAVYGISTQKYGVAGTSVSGVGVSGTSDTGYGMIGESTEGGYGVLGMSHGVISGGGAGTVGVYGLYAASPHDMSGYGVYAESLNGTSLYVNGDAEVSGSLSKGGGSFKIDHPVDPAHKYPYHSPVESPDIMNVYNGTALLAHDGRATVELPDWFESLNRDFRYQLTAIGGAAPDLHVAAEVADGAFGIAGGRPGLKVSWQVTGIRQDAWANAHRIPVEVDKPAADQGRYLHPDLYEGGHGQPVEALDVGGHHVHGVQPARPERPAQPAAPA